ncbi:putative methyltransferase-like 25-like protein [Cladobotryum mycophilum]|uniref:Methyltransferase-like 25-like protein n=1 Tax=Cladobotryum mycophilum TaxID=491253 RepID=A0ABR0SMR1_9HYPO
MLCGGVHILDFFTIDPGIFHATLPEEWRSFMLSYDIMKLLDLFLRDDLDNLSSEGQEAPESLLQYIRSLRRFSLRRGFAPRQQKLPILPRTVAVGMKPKKIHEVINFADYVDSLSNTIAEGTGSGISHFVDFGSGQNYLGRALASEPYNRHVVAVEGRENNVSAARWYDLKSGLSVRPKAMRNKKMWNQALESLTPEEQKDPEAIAAAVKKVEGTDEYDFKPLNLLEVQYNTEGNNGIIQYISGKLDSGDLSEVIENIEHGQGEDLKLMAVSIHSCGNLSHYGIKSLVLNPDIRAVAIVGCCYNLMTEKLGPPTYKHSILRPSLQAINGRVVRESEKRDPQGFPMSQRFSTYKDDGVRLNITARMMACQAPENWTRVESEGFFTRHFFRAVLQRIFLDRGVVSHVWHHAPDDGTEMKQLTPFNTSTNPVIIGALRKRCYGSLKEYVRGAVEKLTTSTDYKRYADVMREKMGDITDEEIERYETMYLPRRKELCVMWSLMALSAVVVESLIVTDRWMFLKEQDMVKHAWVETVFDYGESPRNLVVVGVKKEDA